MAQRPALMDTNTKRLQVETLAATTVAASTVEVLDYGRGIVLRSPDGTRYRVTVANGGALTVARA